VLRKKAKISIIIFIIIVIIPSFFLFYLWKHPELYTPYLIHQLEKVTGLKVSIEKGTINFRKGRFGFSLVKVTLRKKEEKVPFFKAKELFFVPDLFALILGKIHIKKVMLIKPDILWKLKPEANKKLKTKRLSLILTAVEELIIDDGYIRFFDYIVDAKKPLVTTLKSIKFRIQTATFKEWYFLLNTLLITNNKKSPIKIRGNLALSPESKPLPLKIKAFIVAKEIDGKYFRAYYQPYIPMKIFRSFIDIDADFNGIPGGVFESKGNITIKRVKFSYPQVFSNLITPKKIGINYKFILKKEKILIPEFKIDLDEFSTNGSFRINFPKGKDIWLESLVKAKIDLKRIKKYIPFHLIGSTFTSIFKKNIKGSLLITDGYVKGTVKDIKRLNKGINKGVIGGKFVLNDLEFSVPTIHKISAHLSLDANRIKIASINSLVGSKGTLKGKGEIIDPFIKQRWRFDLDTMVPLDEIKSLSTPFYKRYFHSLSGKLFAHIITEGKGLKRDSIRYKGSGKIVNTECTLSDGIRFEGLNSQFDFSPSFLNIKKISVDVEPPFFMLLPKFNFVSNNIKVNQWLSPSPVVEGDFHLISDRGTIKGEAKLYGSKQWWRMSIPVMEGRLFNKLDVLAKKVELSKKGNLLFFYFPDSIVNKRHLFVKGNIGISRRLKTKAIIKCDYLNFDKLFPKKEKVEVRETFEIPDWLTFFVNGEIDIDLEIKKGAFRNCRFHNLMTHFNTTGREPVIYIKQFKADLLKGFVSNQGWIELNKDKIKFEFSPFILKISGDEFNKIFLEQKRKVYKGFCSFDAFLRGEGRNFKEIRRSISGYIELFSENGILKKFEVISRILSLVNLAEIQQVWTKHKGLPYNSLVGELYFEQGEGWLSNLVIDSPLMAISAQGDINIWLGTIDWSVALCPRIGIDRLLSKVPVIGKVLTGEKGSLFCLYYKEKGPIDDPEVKSVPVKTITKGLFDIIIRGLEIPYYVLAPLKNWDK